MIGRQPNGDVLPRLLRLARLMHQVEAAGLHWLPHPRGPTGSTEKLTLVEVEPQVPMRHHPQVALTHGSKDRHGGDGIGGEVLELDAVVMAERPQEAAWWGSKTVAVKLGEEDDIPLWRVWLLVVCRRSDPLGSRRGGTGAQEPLLLQVP